MPGAAANGRSPAVWRLFSLPSVRGGRATSDLGGVALVSAPPPLLLRRAPSSAAVDSREDACAQAAALSRKTCRRQAHSASTTALQPAVCCQCRCVIDLASAVRPVELQEMRRGLILVSSLSGRTPPLFQGLSLPSSPTQACSQLYGVPCLFIQEPRHGTPRFWETAAAGVSVERGGRDGFGSTAIAGALGTRWTQGGPLGGPKEAVAYRARVSRSPLKPRTARNEYRVPPR